MKDPITSRREIQLRKGLTRCTNTSSISEEGGGDLSFYSIIDKAGQVVAAKGVQCSGNYCDNKAFEVCEIVAR